MTDPAGWLVLCSPCANRISEPGPCFLRHESPQIWGCVFSGTVYHIETLRAIGHRSPTEAEWAEIALLRVVEEAPEW